MLKPNQPAQQPNLADQQKQDRNRQKGTGFTNLNRVLGANVGAGEKMGQKIGTSLSTQAGDIRKGIEAGKSQFQAGMSESADKAQGAIGGAQTAFQGIMNQQKGEEQPDYQKIGEQLRGAAYQGPQGIQQQGQLRSQAATAAALGKLGATAGGQQQLLASQVAQRGRYGSGQSALDRALISKDGQQQIQQGRSALSGIQGKTESEIQGAQNQATAQAAAIEANKAATKKQIQEGLTGEQGINTLAAKQAQDYGAKAARLKEIILGQQSGADYIPQEGDEEILNNAEQFGAQNANIYTADPTAYQTSLNALANSMVTDFSGKKMYEGGQQQQAANIAKLLGDQQSVKDIEGSQFDKNVFQSAFKEGDTNRAIFNPMQQAKQADESTLANYKQRVNDSNELAQLAATGNVGGRMYDLMESFRPGIRAEIDKLPERFRRDAYAQIAKGLANQAKADFSNKQSQQQEKIKSNTKDLFSNLKERLKKKDK